MYFILFLLFSVVNALECDNPLYNHYGGLCSTCKHSKFDPLQSCRVEKTCVADPTLDRWTGCVHTKCDDPTKLPPACTAEKTCDDPAKDYWTGCGFDRCNTHKKNPSNPPCDYGMVEKYDACHYEGEVRRCRSNKCTGVYYDPPSISVETQTIWNNGTYNHRLLDADCSGCYDARLSFVSGCKKCKGGDGWVFPTCTKCINPSHMDYDCLCINTLKEQSTGCTSCINTLLDISTDCTTCKNGKFGDQCDLIPCADGLEVAYYDVNYYAQPGGSDGHVTGITEADCLSLVGSDGSSGPRVSAAISDTALPYGCIELAASPNSIIGFNGIGTGACDTQDYICVQKSEEIYCSDDTDGIKARYKTLYQGINGCSLT
jgi:hypothetical protein